MQQPVVRVGEWLVTPSINQISRNGRQLTLEPRLIDLLVFFAQHSGEVLSRDELIDNVWKRSIVTNHVVTQSISELRNSLKDNDEDSPVYIATVPKRGYKLMVPVIWYSEEEGEEIMLSSPPPIPEAVPATDSPSHSLNIQNTATPPEQSPVKSKRFTTFWVWFFFLLSLGICVALVAFSSLDTRLPMSKSRILLNPRDIDINMVNKSCNSWSSPEESPENKTGIVRCDLIDCANNFKEITTMPARSLCQNFLNNILAPLHLYRQKSLIDATNAVINGASLTLTSIGRHLTGTASVKNKIKRVDRLLGNRHLQNEVSTIFQRITQKITRGMSRVVILIDWSAYHASRFQLLRASLACDGRSLPLMSCVVPSSQTANADVHERFLESLAECFSPGTDVIVITDAGFQGRWFQQLRSRGWTYICRVLGNHYYNVGNGWEKVSDSGTKASTTAIYLGEGLLGRDKNAQHEGHFYLYKSKPKGRRFKRSKERATRPSVTAKARTAGKSPWFIFTNSTEFSPKQVMKLYSRRMQIEQNFRDEKNPRWGFGLRFGASHSSGRVTVLSLIATLASIIMWLSGFSLENKGIHHKYQANTVKHRRVISLLKLAENVIRHSPLILNTLSLDAGLKVLQQRYTNMIMVY
ncbi:transposase [Escherichia coli]|nr:transposase [Escherichia coli]